MKRPTLVVFLGLVAALLALVWVQRSSQGGRASGHAVAGTSASAHPGPSPSAGADRLEVPAAALDDPESGGNADAGGLLGDGGVVPELGTVSPKSVVFGVILVQYANAQGAPPGTRPRAEADRLAAELAELGKKDFKAAVERGDPGSTPNAGRMFRGVLEPAPEFAMFSLAVGEVSAPVDTPRGWWIIRRVE